MADINYEKIELLVLDVDGVLTDGRIVLTASGEEIKSFHVRDGAGMRYWKRLGRKLAVITGRGSPAVQHRLRELEVDAVKLNARDKLPAYEKILADLGVGEDQTAVIGDDLMELPMMRRCALPIAVADAAAEVRQAAAYVTDLPGGAGAVREAIERILRNAGQWNLVMQRYLPDEGAKES